MSPPPAPTLSVLIVDDEALARQGIRMLAERDPEVRVVGECASGTAAVTALKRQPVDLVFLDIQMPGLDGFAALAQAAEAQPAPAVIFVTAFADHAVRAFEVQAVDYLLKPFDDERFRRALERAKAHLRVRRLARQIAEAVGVTHEAAPPAPPVAEPEPAYLERLVIKRGGRLSSLPVEDIDWIEAQDYYAEVHAMGRTDLVRMSLRELQARLDPRQFVRIHRSTIVNVRRVKELEPLFHGEYEVRLYDGTQLKLSRTFKDQLDRLLGAR
ncbi:MAG TPA: LytTR family DNA-binding domain-containing protein [Polyangia bacterium]|nr:LytTR family DNA-binding domain-containing protein [Polyangia bacterium]